MSGVRDLETLLAAMRPVLLEEEYVFVSFPDGNYGDGAHLNPVVMVRENEGMTLIVTREAAQSNNQQFESVFRCISLQVHSSLDAVGLTAAVSTRLAEADISANVVAGFYHDHVFVNAGHASEAMLVLENFGHDRIDP